MGDSRGGLDYGRSTALLYEPFMFALTFGHYRRTVAREVTRLRLAADERVLDLCSGTGLVAAELARHLGPEGKVTAVDYSPAMLKAAGRKLSPLARLVDRAAAGTSSRGRQSNRPLAELVEADASALPLPEAQFDAVTMFLGLHEVTPSLRPAALAEMRRVLRPGGRGVLLDLGGQGPAWKLELARWVVTALEGPDAWTLTRPGLSTLIEQAGLEPAGSEPRLWGLFEAVSFRKPTG